MKNKPEFLNNIQLIVFDWDGTLSDSETMIVNAMQNAIINFNAPQLSANDIRNVIGLGLDEAILAIYPEMENAERKLFAEEYRNQYLKISAGGATPLFPETMEILKYLHELGYLLAVATGKSRRGLDRSLSETKTEKYFHASRCADECFSKPHPQMLEQIMETLTINPENTIMVGDSEYDLQMAVSAGTGAIAVSYGVHDINRLLQYKPVACVDNLTELKNIFVYQ